MRNLIYNNLCFPLPFSLAYDGNKSNVFLRGMGIPVTSSHIMRAKNFHSLYKCTNSHDNHSRNNEGYAYLKLRVLLFIKWSCRMTWSLYAAIHGCWWKTFLSSSDSNYEQQVKLLMLFFLFNESWMLHSMCIFYLYSFYIYYSNTLQLCIHLNFIFLIYIYVCISQDLWVHFGLLILFYVQKSTVEVEREKDCRKGMNDKILSNYLSLFGFPISRSRFMSVEITVSFFFSLFFRTLSFLSCCKLHYRLRWCVGCCVRFLSRLKRNLLLFSHTFLRKKKKTRWWKRHLFSATTTADAFGNNSDT